MDREALILRNRSMAEAFHQVPFKHQLRRGLLNTAGMLPIARSMSGMERILLIRPDHLGDVLLSTPAIRALRDVKRYAQIHVLVGPWSAEVISNYPEVDAALTLPFPGFSRTPKQNLRSPYELAWTTSRHLRRIGYTSVVIMRPDHWWGALVAKLAGIPERIGYHHPDVSPFLTHGIEQQHEHAVIQNLRLVEKWTGEIAPENITFRFPVDSIDQAFINGYLAEWNISPIKPIFCIHPGSGTIVKQWPAEKWASVADTLAEQLDAVPILTGGDHEMPIAQRIASQMRHKPIIMAGDTRVGQLAALFKRARVVLGADSGPLHLAAAVGAPTVALFGPADPVEFGTWGDSEQHFVLTSDIGCRPCRVLDWVGDDLQYHPCVREITVARVLDAARRAANPG